MSTKQVLWLKDNNTESLVGMSPHAESSHQVRYVLYCKRLPQYYIHVHNPTTSYTSPCLTGNHFISTPQGLAISVSLLKSLPCLYIYPSIIHCIDLNQHVNIRPQVSYQLNLLIYLTSICSWNDIFPILSIDPWSFSILVCN